MTRLRMTVGLVLAAAISAVVTSLVVVEPGEAVVVRRFGRAVEPAWGPGLHFGLPWGAEKRDRLRLDEVRKIEVGIGDEEGPDLPPGAGEYLTADGNFVIAKVVVQYRIENPTRFVTASEDLDRFLTRAVESAATRAFARRSVAELLVSARGEAARDIARGLADSIRRADPGIEPLNVSLTETRPPTEVLAEFNDAQAAASERESRSSEAATEAGLRISRAESRGKTIVEAARAAADRAVALARGKAEAFATLAERARENPDLTRRRLFADALAELLPRVGRKILDGDAGGDLTILGIDKAP